MPLRLLVIRKDLKDLVEVFHTNLGCIHCFVDGELSDIVNPRKVLFICSSVRYLGSH